MFGIYLPTEQAFYRPENGFENVDVLKIVEGNQAGAAGYGRHCIYHALKLKDGKEILVQEGPLGMGLELKMSEAFFSYMNNTKTEGRKQHERLILILEGNHASQGWLVDSTNFSDEERKDARCTLEKVKSAR